MAKGIRRIAGGWQIRFTYAGTAYCKTVDGPDTAAGLKSAAKERDLWIEAVTKGRDRRRAPTFGEVAQDYLNGLDVKLSTRQTYRAILNGYWMPQLTTLAINSIRPTKIREVLGALELTGKTKKNILIPLRGVFDLAVEDEWIDANPVGRVRLKKHQKPQVDRFTPDEKARILKKLSGDHHLYFLILFEAGMRPGEVLALKWEDFDGKELRVNKAIVRRRVTDTKTHEARRVHCTVPLRTALSGHHRRFAGGYVFRNSFNRCHLDTDEFNAAWKVALAAARVPYRIPYTCRHTRAAEMLMTGVEPAYAARQLGHSLEMFFRTYAEWIRGVKDAEQAAKLDANWLAVT